MSTDQVRPVDRRSFKRVDAVVDLDEMVTEFFATSERSDLGVFEETQSLESPHSELLHHEHHMTVTLETFHQCPVQVEVLRLHRDGLWYSREIILRRTSDGRPVQYGIVRMLTTSVSPEVWAKIESEEFPLGRVLIEHNVHRRVSLCRLWKVKPGRSLQKHLELSPQAMIAGRTALIYCNHQPAIELLEIVRD
ncbi:MAG: hypothetical protein AAF664_05360 [Planctomycetota bacterium]